MLGLQALGALRSLDLPGNANSAQRSRDGLFDSVHNEAVPHDTLPVMCIAVPVRVAKLLDEQWIEVDTGTGLRRVSVVFLGELALGDYVIVHLGFAIARLDPSEAQQTLALFDEIAAMIYG